VADELDRLFQRLVEALAQDVRLAVPFRAADVYERLVPYRSNRSRLRVATHQDYEMTVLRLLAGERGYVRTEPDDVREGLEREAQAVNPETALFRSFPDASVMINRLAAERFLRGDRAYAPPANDEEPEPAPVEAEDSEEAPQRWSSGGEGTPPPSPVPLPFSLENETPDQCPYCGGVVPGNRKVNFCPHCGQPPSGELKCPACGSEVDVGWAYCVGCGRATGFE
jgi:hypothetical protein